MICVRFLISNCGVKYEIQSAFPVTIEWPVLFVNAGNGLQIWRSATDLLNK